MRVSSEDSARNAIKELNKESRTLLGGMHKVMETLREINRFYHQERSNFNGYNNLLKSKNASSDILILSRKIDRTLKDWKNLAELTYPSFVQEEEEEYDEGIQTVSKSPPKRASVEEEDTNFINNTVNKDPNRKE